MSGAKRRSKYRKHVQAALLDALPEPAEGELVAMVKHTKGRNVLEVGDTHAATWCELVQGVRGRAGNPDACVRPDRATTCGRRS